MNIESRTRVALVEDKPSLVTALSALISATPGFEVVATANSGEEALETIPALAPQIVLMDLQLPEMSGVECVERLKKILPETEFMILTVFEDHEQVFASLRAGASGYLVKGLGSEKLIEAIRELRDGGSPMSSFIARKVALSFRQPLAAGGCESLSMREEEVLRALSAGRRYKEIADDLGVSAHTVRTHLRRIYKKLHVRTKAEAARAYRRG